MAAPVIFENNTSATVSSGGTTAPAGGTSESWTIASSVGFPTSMTSGVNQFHVADPALPSEKMLVTAISGTTAWTVTRGDEGTTPVAHSAGFSIQQTVTAGEFTTLSGTVFNVKAYGATGNGSTVDSTAVQAASTAAIASGGTLFFPPGTYVMSGVYFGSNVIVQGSGEGVTILLMDPAASTGSVVCRVAAASSVVSTSNCVVRDLTIDGNKSAWGNNSNQKGYGYYLGQGTAGLISFCQMVNVEIRNCLTYSFDIENATDILIDRCWAHDNGYTTGTGTLHTCDGYTVIGSDIILSNCLSYNNSNNGYLVGQNGFTWYRCKLINCVAGGNNLHGADLGSNSGGFLYDSAVIGGSYTDSVTGSGVQLTVNAQRCVVSGATITGNDQNGIRISGASYNTITGNTLNGNATAGSSNPEIYLLNTSTYNVVTGNSVNGTTALYAISEQTTADNHNVYTGNNVISQSTPVINLFGANSNTTGNVGFDAATYEPWQPADLSLLMANLPDPALAGSTSTTTAGTIYLHKFTIREAMTISNICFLLTTAGSGTSTQSFVGLYNSSGTLLSGSSDIGSHLTGSTGLITCPLTTAQAVTAGSFVWAVILTNMSVTQPTLARLAGTSLVFNAGLTAALYRWATNGTTQTSLPTITPSSNSLAGLLAFWCGVS